jgi:hypothetical protein
MYDSGPANNATSVTPHATNALAPIPRCLYVGGTGDLVLRAAGSNADVTLVGVPAGSFIPIRAQYVRATSTATDIVALF